MALPQPNPPTTIKTTPAAPPHIVEKAKALAQANITGEVLNLWAWGSRWYGIYSEASDWDFLAIVTGYTQPEINNVIQSEDVDVALYEVNYFQRMLDEHIPWVIQFLFHPPEGVYLLRHKFHFDLRFKRLKSALVHNVNYNAGRSWRQGLARSYWRTDHNIRKSKKRINYCFQVIAWSKQVIQTHAVVDRQAGLQYYEQILAANWASYEEMHAWYSPICELFMEDFKEATKGNRHFEESCQSYRNPPLVPMVLQYADKVGPRNVTIETSVECRQHQQNPELLSFNRVRECAPDSEMAAESVCLVANQHDHYQPIASSFRHRLPYDHKHAPGKFNWTGTRVYRRYNGKQAVLYHYAESCPSGTPEPAPTFAQRFWSIFNLHHYAHPTDTNLCYIFELIGHGALRDILYYETEDAICVGALDTKTRPMAEIPPDKIKVLHPTWTCVSDQNPTGALKQQDLMVHDRSIATGPSEGGYVVLEEGSGRGVIVLDRMQQCIVKAREAKNLQDQEAQIVLLLAHYPDHPTVTNYSRDDPTYDSYLKVKPLWAETLAKMESLYAAVKDLPTRPEVNDFYPKRTEHLFFIFSMYSGKYKSAKEYFLNPHNLNKVDRSLVEWWRRTHGTKELPTNLLPKRKHGNGD